MLQGPDQSIPQSYFNVSIDNSLVEEKPKSLNKKNYFRIEEILDKICKKLNMTQAELDLYLWYMKTGEVLK